MIYCIKLKNAKCSRNFHWNISVIHFRLFLRSRNLMTFYNFNKLILRLSSNNTCADLRKFVSILCINSLKNAHLWYRYMESGSINVIFFYNKCIQLFLRISQMFKVMTGGSEWTHEKTENIIISNEQNLYHILKVLML